MAQSFDENCDGFRTQYSEECLRLNVPVSSQSVDIVLNSSLERAYTLIRSLLISTMSQYTSAPLGRKVITEIYTLVMSHAAHLGGNRALTEVYRRAATPLVHWIVGNQWAVGGNDFWSAVQVFLEALEPEIPRSTFLEPSATTTAPTASTPVSRSSASQRGTEETHSTIDDRLWEELSQCAFQNVGGFFEKYFEQKQWATEAEAIVERSKGNLAESIWRAFPSASPTEANVVNWFQDFEKAILGGCSRKYYISTKSGLSDGASSLRPDMVLVTTDKTKEPKAYGWSDVMVVGEIESNLKRDTGKWLLLQLAGYVREVFGHQPTRRFVHAFSLCGSLMRLWNFDRSGAFCSTSFDICTHQERFVTVIAGYTLMPNVELGLPIFVCSDEGGNYIEMKSEGKIYLQKTPIASTKAIVCRGTTCFLGRKNASQPWSYVVKLSWQSDKRVQEGVLLNIANTKNVTGVPRLVDYEQILINDTVDRVVNLRMNLDFEGAQVIDTKDLTFTDPVSGRRTSTPSRHTSRPESGTSSHMNNLGIDTNNALTSSTSSSGHKRQRGEGSAPHRSKKKMITRANGQPNTTSSDLEQLSSVQSSNVESPALQTSTVKSLEVTNYESSSPSTTRFSDRIHCCLVISPAGRPLRDYKSPRELVEVIRDAINAHRSLLGDGGILHRDISDNNIIIIDSAEGGKKGLLIDLDLAIQLDSSPSGARHRTGTTQFMAIGILEDASHTYRHDLESFFYVFIWMCSTFGRPREGDQKARNASRLTSWLYGDFDTIARTKRGDMDKHAFEKGILLEFEYEFHSQKQLAKDIRQILFPIVDGGLYTGTDELGDKMQVYDQVVRAFNKELSKLQKQEGDLLG